MRKIVIFSLSVLMFSCDKIVRKTNIATKKTETVIKENAQVIITEVKTASGKRNGVVLHGYTYLDNKNIPLSIDCKDGFPKQLLNDTITLTLPVERTTNYFKDGHVEIEYYIGSLHIK